MSAKHSDYRNPEPELSPRQRALTYEWGIGVCPKCGIHRGYSVPDHCGDAHCPQPWDIEASTLPPETLR